MTAGCENDLVGGVLSRDMQVNLRAEKRRFSQRFELKVIG